jgi:hypothetical protein
VNTTVHTAAPNAHPKRPAGRRATALLNPAAVVATTAVFVAVALKYPNACGD